MAQLVADALSFQEYALRESLPLSRVHQAVMDFLRGRDDAVLFGAQAVNAYTGEPRMTQDVDLLSTRAEGLAEEISAYLSDQFHIAARVREVAGGRGYRVFQMRKDGNRHLVDVRSVDALPESRRIEQVAVISPVELIAGKLISYHARRAMPKAGTDWRDLAELLLAFPELKQEQGPVAQTLARRGEPQEALDLWRSVAAQDIRRGDEDDEF